MSRTRLCARDFAASSTVGAAPDQPEMTRIAANKPSMSPPDSAVPVLVGDPRVRTVSMHRRRKGRRRNNEWRNDSHCVSGVHRAPLCDSLEACDPLSCSASQGLAQALIDIPCSVRRRDFQSSPVCATPDGFLSVGEGPGPARRDAESALKTNSCKLPAFSRSGAAPVDWQTVGKQRKSGPCSPTAACALDNASAERMPIDLEVDDRVAQHGSESVAVRQVRAEAPASWPAPSKA